MGKTTNIDTLNTEYRYKKPKTSEELNELLLLSTASDIAISIVKNSRSTTKRNECKDGKSSFRNLSVSPLNSNSSSTINTITMGNNRKPKPNGNTQNVLQTPRQVENNFRLAMLAMKQMEREPPKSLRRISDSNRMNHQKIKLNFAAYNNNRDVGKATMASEDVRSSLWGIREHIK